MDGDQTPYRWTATRAWLLQQRSELGQVTDTFGAPQFDVDNKGVVTPRFRSYASTTSELMNVTCFEGGIFHVPENVPVWREFMAKMWEDFKRGEPITLGLPFTAGRRK